jgi:hypothetical protein
MHCACVRVFAYIAMYTDLFIHIYISTTMHKCAVREIIYIYVYLCVYIHIYIRTHLRAVRERAPPEDRRPADEREVDGVARRVRDAQHRRDLLGEYSRVLTGYSRVL